MRESWQVYNILIGLIVGNVELWPAKTFEWRRVTRELRNGGPLEMLTIANLIKIDVLITGQGCCTN